ncbi:Rieske (2Fe-2S) protein [Pseudalkalibacillus berkeleyi]|uniref:Rieske 2Fe-2S domain-containing protein n=1 Tax=Pseudalkalibacillus berkeleyi TaxID=1069813 RepID=A0ABS9H0J3_9BACL|nr:Rieske 2Fe-2S domain-containing protein [Pseudalkalibacillus berkeleyi]MCF6137460.1 Rieske 2Fe-2S domain-containing protein [Pseudalkalibacillus berkeleyi]
MSELNHIHVGTLESLENEGAKIVKGDSHAIAVFAHDGEVHAVDNRCPHMGFPLHQGSLCDGILTCHWHHARFDVKSGGTLDPWADDVPTYPVHIDKDEVFVSPIPHNKTTIQKLQQRLREGLEQSLSLVIGKAVVGLIEAGVSPQQIVSVGVEFGTKHRQSGWRSGLTILTAMTNVLPKLDRTGQILALYQGLVHVARESSGMGTRFLLGALPQLDSGKNHSKEQLQKWYRHCFEVRDQQGAERILLTAIEQGWSNEELANMMLAAVTDHFYVNAGHSLDFHNKAFEILDHVGDHVRPYVLTSLLPGIADVTRSEESHSWQSPVNLVEPLNNVFENLSDVIKGSKVGTNVDEHALVNQILNGVPEETVSVMYQALREGVSPARLAQLVTLAAAERISQFHMQNDFSDWITVLHTFTHAHAVHQSLLRSTTVELTRAVFHSAMTVYLDRFLNMPKARKPKPCIKDENLSPSYLLELLDQQHRVSDAADWVVSYLANDGDKSSLFNTLGFALLREDAEFHSFQMYEAAMIEHDYWIQEDSEIAKRAQESIIVAVTRYLAGHAPTAREMPHLATIAMRLYKGEKLFEEE